MTEQNDVNAPQTAALLTLTNSREKEVTVVLEPWGERYPLAPGDELHLVFSGATPSDPEIDYGRDTMTVYGWPGSSLRVFKNEQELPDPSTQRSPVPKVPPSMRVSEFMRAMFGLDAG